MKHLRRPWAIVLMLIVLEALLPPGDFKLPVAGANPHDWNPDSYWQHFATDDPRIKLKYLHQKIYMPLTTCFKLTSTKRSVGSTPRNG